jgi:hypothetical protein
VGLALFRLKLELQYDAPPNIAQQHPARVLFVKNLGLDSRRLRLIHSCSFLLHLYTARPVRSLLHHSSRPTSSRAYLSGTSSHILHPARQSLRHVRLACEQPLHGHSAPRTRRARAHGAEHALETRRPVRQHASPQPAEADADPLAAALWGQGECANKRAEGQEEEHSRGG